MKGPEESITFAYGALDIAYFQQKADGGLEPPKSAAWNQLTNKAEFASGVTTAHASGSGLLRRLHPSKHSTASGPSGQKIQEAQGIALHSIPMAE